MHRDLKPDNIGFDVRGDLKVFDFGLARDLPLSSLDRNREGDEPVFHGTMAGSIRYMAPEVANGHPYNLKVDVYCFSLIWWQVMALRKPYGNYTDEMSLSHAVFTRGERPPIKKRSDSFSPATGRLLQQGWDGNVQKRADIRTLKRGIRAEIVRVRDSDASGLDDDDEEHIDGDRRTLYNDLPSRRRSTFVFQTKRPLLRQSLYSQNSGGSSRSLKMGDSDDEDTTIESTPSSGPGGGFGRAPL